MAYLSATTTLLLLLPLLAALALYLTRARWAPQLAGLRVPGLHLYSALPGGGGGAAAAASSSSSFAGDIEAGLTSAAFDLAGDNVAAGDVRAGLDDAAKRAILAIMQRRRLRFDEARRVYTEGRFTANGIAPDGRPRDPKFVSFS